MNRSDTTLTNTGCGIDYLSAQVPPIWGYISTWLTAIADLVFAREDCFYGQVYE